MSLVATPAPDRERWRTLAFAGLVGAVVLATFAALVVGDVNPVLAAVPAMGVALAYAMARTPLRWSAAALIFLGLSLELPTDAAGMWHSPLATLGFILQENLERSLHLPGVALSGLDVAALYLLCIAAWRRATRSTIDGRGHVASGSGVRAVLLLYAAGAAYAELVGLARGGPVAIWKLRHLAGILLLYFVFESAFRGPRDHRVLARIVVAAAWVKALLAVYVQRVVAPSLTGGRLAHATNHGDSVLFVVAATIVIASALERLDAGTLARAAFLLAPILVGMKENERRIAWVMLGMVLLAAYLIGPGRPWKRLLTRTALVVVPLGLLYVGVGWNRDGKLFRPVQMLRSVSDSSVDASTRWRDTENWNLAMSIREHPVVGLGLGLEYTEYVRGDDISSLFADFRGWPHNSVLGLLLFAGPFGFTALWSPFAFVVYLAARSYRLARGPDDSAAALACIGTIIATAVLAFGDTGAHHLQYRLLVALSIAVAGKLATATGAWPSRLGRPRWGASNEAGQDSR